MSESIGQMLQRLLDEVGVSQAYLAYLTGISTKHINRVIKGGEKLSVPVALRIEMAVPSISAEALLIAQVRLEIEKVAKKFNEEGGTNG